MPTDQETASHQLELMTLSPSPKPRRDFSLPAVRKQTCKDWTRGSCTRSDCTYAHHLFPTLVYRTYRNGRKLVQCEHWEKKKCGWDSEHCGFAHVDLSTEAGQKRPDVDLIMSRESWRAMLKYECRDCNFETQDIDEIVAHSEEVHTSSRHTGPWRIDQGAEKSNERIRSDSAGSRAGLISQDSATEKLAEIQKNGMSLNRLQQQWSFGAPEQAEKQPQLGESSAASDDDEN